MSLRQTVLGNALKNIPRQSFTRQALLAAAQPDLLESLFGTGLAPERALVTEWEAQGLKAIAPTKDEGVSVTIPKGKSQTEVDFEALRVALGRRIRWSSDTAGEHLVQAHALLATPEHSLSTAFPRPVMALASALGTKLRMDPAYVPPSDQSTCTTPSASPQSKPPQSLTLPLLNPLPLLSYALKIADEALYVSGAEPETKSGELDWYARRIGIAMIYLHAETHLLHPRPHTSTSTSAKTSPDTSTSTASTASTSPPPDPQLPHALKQLDESLARYRAISSFGARVGDLEKEVAQFGWFVWKSWGGIFRSRGWIN